MTSLFLYGPMMCPELRAQVLGPGAAQATITQAVLDGFEMSGDAGGWWPVAAPGRLGVPGVLISGLGEDALDRMAFFAAGLPVSLGAMTVRADGRNIKAIGLIPENSAPAIGAGAGAGWHLSGWQGIWGQLVLSAAQEAMGYYGTITAAELTRRMSMILMRATARAAASVGVPAAVRSDMGADQVKVIAEHTRRAGFFVTREYELRHPGFGGGMSPVVRREVFVATDTAIVLPYDPVRDRVLLVEQFRMGPYGRGDPRPWMLEPVAGRVDPGEVPQETARRECVEEAGIDLKRLEHISSHYCSPGCSTEYFHLYLGICDLPDLVTGQGGLASEDEDIRTHVLGFDQAMALCASGEADNGPLILSLIWLARARKRLRAGA